MGIKEVTQLHPGQLLSGVQLLNSGTAKLYSEEKVLMNWLQHMWQNIFLYTVCDTFVQSKSLHRSIIEQYERIKKCVHKAIKHTQFIFLSI